ncbi:MAG: hypothetical protein M0037_00485 [Betaproteobacteria bacterium]|nr:hypothetical protein [Betaproteobacteria bacterium]
MKTSVRIFLLGCVAVIMGACASYGGRGLEPGVSRISDVIRVMGQPAMRWKDPDGAEQLAYPRGPMGYDTYMVHLGPEGTLKRITNVMNAETFARIQPGMSKAQVLRILGPVTGGRINYFKALDELAWEWRYCNGLHAAARFDVLFDARSGTVRSTMRRVEQCGKSPCWCSSSPSPIPAA